MVRIVLEHQMTQEQVLIEVAAHELLLERTAVEELLPVLHLACHMGRRCWRGVKGCAGGEPACHHIELARCEARQAIGHAGQRMVALVGVELAEPRASLGSVQREIERA
jgi:hypothetical protein